jgi:hypothetical protein
MVPRDLHLGDDEFDSLKVGDRIKVEIQKSRFQLRDPFIVSVGVYRGNAGAPTRVKNSTAQSENSMPSLLRPEGEEEEVEEAEGEEEAAEEEEEEEKKEE